MTAETAKESEATEKTENKAENEAKAFYSDKLKRAVHLLLFRRGKIPGAREWELKEKVGRNYEQVLTQLNQLLSELDLEVKKVKDQGPSEISSKAEIPADEEARYFVALKGTLGLKEAKLIGWRIDNLAALSATIAYIVSKQGKAPREELEKLVANKFGRWKAMTLVDVFLRSGYLEEDDAGTVSLGWRAQSEVDLRALMTKMAEAKV